jgi:branched-subunit amino acid ABC-type transport system permease component
VVVFEAGYKNVVAFTILLLLLFVRPQGIFKSMIE